MDLLHVTLAATVVDLVTLSIVLALGWGRTVRKWYTHFGMSAVCMDVGSLIIATWIAVKTGATFPQRAGVVVALQLVHDISVSQMLKSSNASSDTLFGTWKQYADEVGGYILLVDAVMLVSTLYLSQSTVLAGMNAETMSYCTVVALYLLLVVSTSFEPL